MTSETKAMQLNIKNHTAKAAFVAWWRTMEAQGYQYGHEALCNVWVGFDDGRADLARQLIETVEAEHLHENLDNDGDKGYTQGVNDALAAIRSKCEALGVNLRPEAAANSEEGE